MLADQLEQLLLPPGTIRRRKLRVEHDHAHFGQRLPQPRRKALCAVYGVDDDARATAVRKVGLQPFGQVFECFTPDLYGFRRCIGLHRGLLYVEAVRPCQQRIGQAALPVRRLCRPASGLVRPSLQIRLHERSPACLRQSGRQHNDRCAVLPQPCERAVEVGVHVVAVRMHLVDDDHLARQSKMAQHQVLALQRGHQQLIDRADDELR